MLIARAGQIVEQALGLLVLLAAVCVCVMAMAETQKLWAPTVRDALTETGFNPKGNGSEAKRRGMAAQGSGDGRSLARAVELLWSTQDGNG